VNPLSDYQQRGGTLHGRNSSSKLFVSIGKQCLCCIDSNLSFGGLFVGFFLLNRCLSGFFVDDCDQLICGFDLDCNVSHSDFDLLLEALDLSSDFLHSV
jgi:hypothetical protein